MTPTTLPQYVATWLPELIAAAGNTLRMAIFAFLVAICLGLILALTRLSGRPIVAAIAAFYVEIIRGAPALALLFLIYFGLPNSHANNSVRAAHAAYEIRKIVSSMMSPYGINEKLAVKIGLSRGMVFAAEVGATRGRVSRRGAGIKISRKRTQRTQRKTAIKCW